MHERSRSAHFIRHRHSGGLTATEQARPVRRMIVIGVVCALTILLSGRSHTADARPADGVYYILHLHAGSFSYLTLDVSGAGSCDDHTTIQQEVITGRTSQQWRLTHVGNDFFTIVNVHSGKALDVPGGVQRPVFIQQFGLHGGPNQQWRITTFPAVNGPELFRPEFHRISNRQTGMALDVPNGSQAAGEFLQQFPPHNGWNQTWLLREVPAAEVGTSGCPAVEFVNVECVCTRQNRPQCFVDWSASGTITRFEADRRQAGGAWQAVLRGSDTGIVINAGNDNAEHIRVRACSNASAASCGPFKSTSYRTPDCARGGREPN